METTVKYKKAPNALQIPEAHIELRSWDGVPIERVRVVADEKFLFKGKELKAELRLFDPDTNQQIPVSEATKVAPKIRYRYVDKNGKVLEKTLNEESKEVWPIFYVEIKEDGTAQRVSKFKRTQLIHVPDGYWVPSTTIEGWVIDSVYEIFGDNPISAKKLFLEAEKRLKADQIGMTTFSMGGGFNQQYAFMCPHFQDGKFVWLMKLTNTKLAFDYLQDPPVDVEVPIVEAPTVKTLPPLQALVLAAKA